MRKKMFYRGKIVQIQPKIKRINKTTFLKFIIIEIFREYNSQLQNKYMNEVRY